MRRKKEKKSGFELQATASDKPCACGLGMICPRANAFAHHAHWQRRGKRGRARTRDVQNVTASAADRVSSLCYQGDGEYTALEELFEARGGKLTFGGTLTRVHDCGEVNLPIMFNVSSDQVPIHPAVAEIRQEFGWGSELVCCLATSISIAPLGRHELPSEHERPHRTPATLAACFLLLLIVQPSHSSQ